jgi:hypothetical protein
MPATYEPIATTTLGSAASSITFSSIPGTYTDLRLVVIVKAVNSDTLKVRLNNDTGTNYSTTQLSGDGASAISYRWTNSSSWFLWYNNAVSETQWEFHTWDIFSYTGSTNKTALSTRSADYNGSGEVYRGASLWRDTSTINRIDVGLLNTNMAIGTTATLYGILKA